MYEAHFQMQRRPFPPSADVAAFIGVGSVEQAGQTLLRVVQRGSGPALVIGAAGTGKSMLCELLAEHFGGQMRVALLSNGQIPNPRALFQAILFELGLPYRGLDEGELRLALVELLTDDRQCPNGLLLIVDEAHGLPLEVLEEIRMLTNLVCHGQSRVHLVLAGGAALEEQFTDPQLESFNQRVAARCYLESLNRDETGAYVRGQVAAAGANPDAIFAGDAVNAVYDATDGIPRLINQVCDHALIMAAVGGHASVTADIVQEAWADLQQLPAPFVEPAAQVGTADGDQHVIEFGALNDDEPEAAPASIPFPQHQQSLPMDFEERPTDAPDAFQPQAETRLADIERHLVEADETYELQPETAPTIEPHVEQSTEPATPQPIAATNPFDESFDEEEVVVDSYAALQESQFAGAPRVSSREGREIAARLAAAEESADAEPTRFSVTEQIEEGDGPPTDDSHEATVNELTAASRFPLLADEPAAHLFTDEPMADVDERQAAEGPDHDAQCLQQELTDAVASLLHADEQQAEASEVDVVSPMASLAPTASFNASPSAPPDAPNPSADDRDVIIIEEPEEVNPPRQIAQGKARRQKYRQLFNQLRQG